MPWIRERMTQGKLAVLDTACPVCHYSDAAPNGAPGQPCTSGSGELPYFHRDRVDAAIQRLAIERRDAAELVAAATFARSVLIANGGLFELSERIAIEKIEQAVLALTGKPVNETPATLEAARRRSHRAETESEQIQAAQGDPGRP